MNKLKFAAMLGKTIGYVSFGLTQTLRFTGKVYGSVKNSLSNRPLYNITIIDKNGVVVNEYTAVTVIKVNEVMTSIHHLHDNYKINIEEYNGKSNETSAA